MIVPNAPVFIFSEVLSAGLCLVERLSPLAACLLLLLSLLAVCRTYYVLWLLLFTECYSPFLPQVFFFLCLWRPAARLVEKLQISITLQNEEKYNILIIHSYCVYVCYKHLKEFYSLLCFVPLTFKNKWGNLKKS